MLIYKEQSLYVAWKWSYKFVVVLGGVQLKLKPSQTIIIVGDIVTRLMK